MAELVDAPDLGSGVARREGSSPSPRTVAWLVAALLVAGCGAERPERETAGIAPQRPRAEAAPEERTPPPIALPDAGTHVPATGARDAGLDAGESRAAATTRAPAPRLPRAEVVQIVRPDGTLHGEPTASEGCRRAATALRGVTRVRSEADVERLLGADPRCLARVRRALLRAVAAGQHVLTAAYNYPAAARIVAGRAQPTVRVRTRAAGVDPGNAVWLVIGFYDPAAGELALEHGPTGCERCGATE